MKYLLIITLSRFASLGEPSIVGVTYRDHFDFEERYRDVTECDPMHYYPLHMPPHCLDMYEKLIRKNLNSEQPVRVVKKIKSMEFDIAPTVPLISGSILYPSELEPVEYEEPQHLKPYLKMFKMLKSDVEKEPSAPEITALPGFGMVALYRQPVSRKSGQYIKKISGAYRNVYREYNNFFPMPTVSSQAPETTTKITHDQMKKAEGEDSDEIVELMRKLKDTFGKE